MGVVFVRNKATVTTVQEITIAPKLQKQLINELHGYQQFAEEMKVLKEGKEGCSAKVLTLSDEAGVEKYKLEGFGVSVIKGARDRRLDKEELIGRLVKDGKYSMKAALALVEDCTTDKPKKDYVKITCPGEREDD